MPNYIRAFAENHYIFITAVTYKRNPILIKNIDILRKSLKTALNKYKFELYAAIILPDHFHAIINPGNIADYPKIIAAIKQGFSKNISPEYTEPLKKDFTSSMIKRNESGVWQRRYWEHTIKNQEDLNRHLDYIHYNPVKHGLVENVKDWEYSSFHKFVQNDMYEPNWGSENEPKNVANLNYE